MSAMALALLSELQLCSLRVARTLYRMEADEQPW